MESRSKYWVPRNRGEVKMTYQQLASVLGLKVNSIRTIRYDSNPEILCVIHDDEDFGVWELAEGQMTPQMSSHVYARAITEQKIEEVEFLLAVVKYLQTQLPEEDK